MSTLVPLHASLSLWTWSWDPTVMLGTLALAAGYGWLLRGSEGSLTWSPRARIYFAAGLLTLFLALESPIDVGGDHYLFSLHMFQHLLLAMVVPPLILLGLPDRWLAGASPHASGARGLAPREGRFSAIRAFERFAARRAFETFRIRISPLFASVIFNLVLAIWHLPLLYEATLRSEPLHVLEHLSFLAVGLLFWWPILIPSTRKGSMTVVGKIAYLGFAGVPPTILGLAFILSPIVIYPFYAAAPRVTPLSPLDDQLAAGLVMFGLGNLIYFVAISIIFFSLDDKSATAGDRPAVEIESPATMRR